MAWLDPRPQGLMQAAIGVSAGGSPPVQLRQELLPGPRSVSGEIRFPWNWTKSPVPCWPWSGDETVLTSSQRASLLQSKHMRRARENGGEGQTVIFRNLRTEVTSHHLYCVLFVGSDLSVWPTHRGGGHRGPCRRLPATLSQSCLLCPKLIPGVL